MAETTEQNDTIFASASGHGRAAITVIRLSGPGTRSCVEWLAGSVPPDRSLRLRRLRDSASLEILDESLVVFMPGPSTFTGEDQAELHLHGGIATRAVVLRALGALPGCRLAEPGEFTRRAFLNGRLDLSRAEGLADLIDAETESQRRQALRQLGGGLDHWVEDVRESLLSSMALMEAALDFSDEGDVPASVTQEVGATLRSVERRLAEALENPVGERIRDGFTVVLAGPPNSGKSSLLNRLAQREAAIVSPVPGTTRDAIEVHLDLGGIPLAVIDTAGLRESTDFLEQSGMARTRARAREADLVLWLSEAGRVSTPDDFGAPTLRVATKLDLSAPERACDVAISAFTGEGIAELLTRLTEQAHGGMGGADPLITRQRHRNAFGRAQQAVRRALVLLDDSAGEELVAEELRLAAQAIGTVTGRVDVEDILDRLFSTFCIGK
jgi:tRNA modification GTPase